jgi:putative glutamine amidotransferase
MRPRIAIPVPHSGDAEYAERSLPQYAQAVEMAGGEPVRVPLDRSPAEVMNIIAGCDAVLLPGSRADVDPAKYDAVPHPSTAPADPKRNTVDELLLQDAYDKRKPVLGICYGLQSLNVYRTGTLLQDISQQIPPEKQTVNHEAGRKVSVAHTVEVDPSSRLSKVLENTSGQAIAIPVNSSHHQAAAAPGDGLRVAARCPQDGIIEALEGTSPGHFVLAVQWHPERSLEDERSRAIFRALVEAARSNPMRGSKAE